MLEYPCLTEDRTNWFKTNMMNA